MNTHVKHLPADERRGVTVEAVVELAGSQNPSEITTAAIAKTTGTDSPWLVCTRRRTPTTVISK
ncbi:MAG TPA: hypothetical protein PK439_12605 [Nitrosomonas sp.]|jgi:hypothetical protein|nr:hypothetical protein [Nitrosomonas sp.]